MRSIRKVNIKAVCVLLASLVVLAVAVVSVHAIQVRRNAEFFLSQAEQAEDANRLEEAAKYYYRFLGYRPDSNKARLAWARVLDKKVGKSFRDQKVIFELYEAALRRQPDAEGIRRRLVDVAITLRRFTDAEYHIELLRKGAYAQDGKLEQLFAQCCAAKNDNVKAVRLYQESIRHAPEDVETYTQLAELYGRMGKPNDADKIIDGLVKTNEKDYRAHLARARHLRQRRTVEAEKEAARETEQAYAHARNKPETLLAMVELELSRLRQRPDEARKYLKEGLELYPKNSVMYLTLAQLEMTARRTDEAIACLRRGLKEVPPQGQTQLMHMLALCLLQRGDEEEVKQMITALQERHVPVALINELNARVLMAKGQWTEAAAILEKTQGMVVGDAFAEAQLNRLVGYCHEKRGEPDRALSAYKQALTADPGLFAAHVGAGNAYAALGRADDALAEYRGVMAEIPEVGAKVARLLLRQNMRLEKAKRNWDKFDEALTTAAKAAPGSTEVTLLRVQALLAREHNAEAQALIQKSCKEQPAKLDLWLAWADLEDFAGAGVKTLEILQEAESKLGDRVELRLARAWHWLQRQTSGGEERDAALRKLEDNTEHFSNDEKAQLLRGLGDVYSRAGNLKEAKRLWNNTAALLPQDVQIRLTLFELALQEQDDKAVSKLANEIKVLDSEGTVWRYTRANGLISMADKGNRQGLAEARRLLVEVSARRRLWSAPLRKLAAIDDLEGNPQQALENYEQALQLGDRDPLALRRVIQLLWTQQRFTEASQVLQRLDDQGTLSDEGRKARAWFLIQQGENETAIELARQAVANGATDLRDRVFLGQILWAAGEKHYREAEKTLREATRMPGAEKSAEPWVVLVQFLAGTQQKARASAVIDEARRKLSLETAALALAQCYEATEEFAKAAAEFGAALKKNPNDLIVLRNIASFHLRRGHLNEAQPYLRRLLEPEARAGDADAAWARRGIALSMSNEHNYQRLQEARKLLEENTRAGGGTLEDRRTLAVLLAAHPQTRREALRILESLQGGQEPTLEQRLVLAILYELTRDWSRARQAYSALASSALAATEPKLDYVAYSARALLRHGDVGEASVWLQKLEKKDPDSLPTLDVRIRILKTEGRAADAVTLLARYVQKPDANLEAAAGLYEEIGYVYEAEQLYWKLSHQGSGSQRLVVLARFLARNENIDDALDVCERLARMGSPDLAADAAVAALRGRRKASADQYRRVERLLDEAIKRGPHPETATLQLASLRELQENFNEAEAIYRQVLERDPNNSAALNNLAWLLGLQTGKASEGLILIDRALKQSGELPDLLDTRAVIYLKLGEARNAIADLDTALLDADLATLYFHRAQALLLSNRKAALEDLRKARELKLTREKLHPLERQAYDQLVAALGEK